MDYSALEYISGVTTRQVFRGRCVLLSVIAAGDGAAGDLQLYDGAGTGDPQKLHLEMLTGVSMDWQSVKGILLNNGIYVVVNATTTKASVEYTPLEY